MDEICTVGKKYFFRTKHDRVYAGVVTKVDTSSPPLVFFYILDRNGKNVMLLKSELIEVKEEQ